MITKLISLLKNIVCFELTISFKPVVVRCLFVDCWVYLTFLLCSCAAIMFVSGLLLPGFKLMAWLGISEFLAGVRDAELVHLYGWGQSEWAKAS